MESTNFKVIQSINNWLKQGDKIWLITVLETWGASPRPPGSLFAYNSTANIQVGSLSGGCIEEDLVVQLGSMPLSQRPIRKLYGVDQSEVERFHLPCGGKVELVLECLGAHCHEHFSKLERVLENKQQVSRHISLSTGEMCLKKCTDYSGALSSSAKPTSATSSVEVSDLSITHHISPAYRLLIVGLGEVAIYLASFAKSVEFNVSICEPRTDYIQRYADRSAGVPIIQSLPDDLIRENFNDAYCAIVTVAHDPRVDDLALLEALNSSAFYIGSMGSLKTTENRIERLKQLDTSHDALKKLHAPIGMAIGSKTPPEIAISIISELVMSRHNCKDSAHK